MPPEAQIELREELHPNGLLENYKCSDEKNRCRVSEREKIASKSPIIAELLTVNPVSRSLFALIISKGSRIYI